MDDKKYNVWMIMNKDGKFYHAIYKMVGRTPSGKPKMASGGIEWSDDFYKASFFNYKGAEKVVSDLKMKNLSIVGYEEYQKIQKKK